MRKVRNSERSAIRHVEVRPEAHWTPITRPDEDDVTYGVPSVFRVVGEWFEVSFRVERGRLTPFDLRIPGDIPVAATEALALGDLGLQAIEELAEGEYVKVDVVRDEMTFETVRFGLKRAEARRVVGGLGSRRGRPSSGAEDLKEVARVYLASLEAGQRAPLASVADMLGVTEATARRRLRQAADEGWLTGPQGGSNRRGPGPKWTAREWDPFDEEGES